MSLQNTEMFDRIAKKYGIVNTIFSFGLDKYFRNSAAKIAIRENSSCTVLDTATGTGDFLLALIKRSLEINTRISITGIDLSSKMLEIAKKKLSKFRDVKLYVMDATMTSFTDSSFDIITNSMALRNFDSKADFFKESFRLLRPGGRLIILDTVAPEGLLNKIFFDFYFKVIKFEGSLIDKKAYTFMVESILKQKLSDVIDECISAGFKINSTKHLFTGIAVVIEAVKPLTILT
jgi:demethylmenaquinone methyltransferase/2-methoxy-6-polyprenyl-1,4-benzoquinol methylase